MKAIDEQKLERITGGFSTLAALGIASLVLFVAGVIDGQIKLK